MKLLKFAIFLLFIVGCTQIGKIPSSSYCKEITKKIDTIEVQYIAWACACPNWIETKYIDSIPNYQLEENNDCFFLEKQKNAPPIPLDYEQGGYSHRLRLIGQYYKDLGISRDYIKQTKETPSISKVFRYSKFEIINPDLKNQIDFFTQISKEKEINHIYKTPITFDSTFFKYHNDKISVFFSRKETNLLKKSTLIPNRSIPLNYWRTRINIIENKDDIELQNNQQYKTPFHEVSLPLFNKDYTKALFKIHYHCGRYCSYEEIYVYIKKEYEWVLKSCISSKKY